MAPERRRRPLTPSQRKPSRHHTTVKGVAVIGGLAMPALVRGAAALNSAPCALITAPDCMCVDQ